MGTQSVIVSQCHSRVSNYFFMLVGRYLPLLCSITGKNIWLRFVYKLQSILIEELILCKTLRSGMLAMTMTVAVINK